MITSQTTSQTKRAPETNKKAAADIPTYFCLKACMTYYIGQGRGCMCGFFLCVHARVLANIQLSPKLRPPPHPHSDIMTNYAT